MSRTSNMSQGELVRWSDYNNPNNDFGLDDWADCHNPNNDDYVSCFDDSDDDYY